MKRPFLFLGLAAILGMAVFWGCGRSVNNNFETNGNKSGDPAPVIPPEASVDYSDALRKLRQIQVTCPTGDCHPGVGMLASMEGGQSAYSIRRCTAFLIDSQTIVTAAHCVPSEVLQGQAPISERVQVAFAAQGIYSAQRALALGIVRHAPAPNYAGQDVVFLKISEVHGRLGMELSNDGLPEDEALLEVVRPVARNETEGEIRIYPVRVVQKTLLLPQFQNAFAGAGTIGGNSISSLESSASGGPLLLGGSVRGVLTRIASLPQSFTSQRSLGLSNKLEKTRLGLVTNLACLESHHPECDEDLSLAATQALWDPVHWVGPNAIERAEGMMKQQVAVWQTSTEAAKILKWDMTVARSFYTESSTRVARFTAVPVCFEKPEEWLGRYQAGTTYRKKASLGIDIPKWVFKFEFNEFLQLESKVLVAGNRPARADLEFSPAELKTQGTTRVHLNYADSGNPVSVFESNLKFCP